MNGEVGGRDRKDGSSQLAVLWVGGLQKYRLQKKPMELSIHSGGRKKDKSEEEYDLGK